MTSIDLPKLVSDPISTVQPLVPEVNHQSFAQVLFDESARVSETPSSSPVQFLKDQAASIMALEERVNSLPARIMAYNSAPEFSSAPTKQTSSASSYKAANNSAANVDISSPSAHTQNKQSSELQSISDIFKRNEAFIRGMVLAQKDFSNLSIRVNMMNTILRSVNKMLSDLRQSG